MVAHGKCSTHFLVFTEHLSWARLWAAPTSPFPLRALGLVGKTENNLLRRYMDKLTSGGDKQDEKVSQGEEVEKNGVGAARTGQEGPFGDGA